jgi:sulfide:quinone oxidoreductase
MSKTVAVLGAGVGGLTAAARLRENLPSSDRILLIDRSFSGSLGLSSLWVLRGWRQLEQVAVTPTPAALPGVSMVAGEVVRFDTDAKTVYYRQGNSILGTEYDAAVIALGAALNTAATPGLDAAFSCGVAGQFYTAEGAADLHRRIDGFESGRIVVLVAALPFKCPAAPYEAAFLLADLLGDRFSSGAVGIDVITPEPQPMPVAGPHVGDALIGMLAGRGIGFHPGKTIRTVDPAARALEFDDGTTEPFDLLAAVPQHTSPAASVLVGGVNPGGWIPVDAATLATGLPGVWAVGDSTALMLAHGKPLPKAAVFARAEAQAAADQLARYLGYDAPDTRFSGEGACYVEFGAGLAAKGVGNFLAAPAPQVNFYPPSATFHAEKEQEEREWLARWNSPT